jgi:uncharacterized protein (DUF302 family)/uncharacterized membrane protein YidH (DUF202 family)
LYYIGFSELHVGEGLDMLCGVKTGEQQEVQDTPTEIRQKAALSDYLAAERTLLAWIRTGLGLMGFGFVVARFANGLSMWLGIALIVVGVFVNMFAGWHHLQLVRELDHGRTEHSRASTEVVAIALFLALIGLAMSIYLILVSRVAGVYFEKRTEISMTLSKGEGIINLASNHPVDQTVETLKEVLEVKGVNLFALVDHAREAERVGMKMRPTKLLIFGNPKGGTPLMLAAPGIAIDLPLKILVWEDIVGKVWVSYNSPTYLQERHGIPRELVQNIAVVETLAAKAAE